jgi:hypothetical protein
MTCGVHLSAGHEERAKAARLEASSYGGGGNPVGRQRLAGRLGRPKPSGNRGSGRLERKKRMGHG